MRLTLKVIACAALACATAHKRTAGDWRTAARDYVRMDEELMAQAGTREVAEIYQRRAAIVSQLREEPFVPASVIELLRSSDEDRIAGLVLTLVQRSTPRELVAPILHLLVPEQPLLVRYYAAQALASVAGADLAALSSDIARAASRERGPLLRVMLLPTITRLGQEDRVRVIAQYLRESEEPVRRASYVAAKAAGFANEVRTVLTREGEDKVVREIDALDAELRSQ